MFRQIFALSAVFGILGMSLIPANAQSFTSRGRAVSRTQTSTSSIGAAKSSFDINFERFNRDLGEAGSRMKSDHAMLESANSANQTAQASANQIDTAATAQRGFNNSQSQALNSGGLYNTPVRTNIGIYPEQFWY